MIQAKVRVILYASTTCEILKIEFEFEIQILHSASNRESVYTIIVCKMYFNKNL